RLPVRSTLFPYTTLFRSLDKFESMLKTNSVYFFDSEDFQEIIHHYLDSGKVSLAKKAIKIGLEQHPTSSELKLLNVEVLIFENKDRKSTRLNSSHVKISY